jgi:hypothetical protein
VKLIANLELGLAQLLAVGLARQQAREAAGFIQKDLLQQLVEALGFGFLFRREVVVHDGPSWRNSLMRFDSCRSHPFSRPLSRRLPNTK